MPLTIYTKIDYEHTSKLIEPVRPLHYMKRFKQRLARGGSTLPIAGHAIKVLVQINNSMVQSGHYYSTKLYRYNSM